MNHIFIGHDERETDAVSVCKKSIEENSKNTVVHLLKHKELREAGVFTRPWVVEGDTGRFLDSRDGRNFSTQFSHTRFSVPYFAENVLGIKKGLVAFVDCDFVFLDNIDNMFDSVDKTKPVSCVKHKFEADQGVKMDGQVQFKHPKKLWSSLMVFNMEHPELVTIKSKQYFNHEDGRNLHNFTWVKEESIGEIDERWNFIPDHSEARVEPYNIGAIHYTLGGPNFEHLKFTKYHEYYHMVEEKIILEKLLDLSIINGEKEGD